MTPKEHKSVDWVEVMGDRLVRRQSLGTAAFGVLGDHMPFVGPVPGMEVCARRHPTGGCGVRRGDDGAPPPRTRRLAGGPRQHVAPKARGCHVCNAGTRYSSPSKNAGSEGIQRPAPSVAKLHNGMRAWFGVIVALEPRSSALRLYDRMGGPKARASPG